MGEVATELQAWQIFFAAFSEASAALLGLLFVAVSLLAGSWRRAGRVSLVVNQSGIALLYPLIAALVMLVPAGIPWVQGIAMLGLAVAGVANSVRSVLTLRRSGNMPPVSERVRRDIPAVIGAIVYGVSGLALLLDSPIGVYGVALASFVMIVAGTLNTWALLIGRGEDDAAG